MDEPKDPVECHSGYEYAERPTALYWEGDRLEVAEILDRWRIPGAHCFRVRTADDDTDCHIDHITTIDECFEILPKTSSLFLYQFFLFCFS